MHLLRTRRIEQQNSILIRTFIKIIYKLQIAIEFLIANQIIADFTLGHQHQQHHQITLHW